jgi:hypothetical protein
VSIINHAHPMWCDPRVCSHTRHDFDHRSTPMQWTSSVDDFLITTSLAQLDELSPLVRATGRATVSLGLRDLASTNLDGSQRALETDLSVQDARLLAAALVAAAEELEGLQRREVTQ